MNCHVCRDSTSSFGLCRRHKEFFDDKQAHEKELKYPYIFRVHPFMVWKAKSKLDRRFEGRNIGLRHVDKRRYKNIVFNEVYNKRDDYKTLLTLHHINLEFIHDVYEDDWVLYFISNVFVAKLADVWKNIYQPIDSVDKIFLDFYKGLVYLKSKNICHGSIHENNLAFDGELWYIAGLVGADKTGENESFCGTSVITAKSPRYFFHRKNNSVENSVPDDDLWQLIVMFCITKFKLERNDIVNWLGQVTIDKVKTRIGPQLTTLLMAGSSDHVFDDEQYDQNYEAFRALLTNC